MHFRALQCPGLSPNCLSIWELNSADSERGRSAKHYASIYANVCIYICVCIYTYATTPVRTSQAQLHRWRRSVPDTAVWMCFLWLSQTDSWSPCNPWGQGWHIIWHEHKNFPATRKNRPVPSAQHLLCIWPFEGSAASETVDVKATAPLFWRWGLDAWMLATIHLKDCGLSDVRQSFGLRREDLQKKLCLRHRPFVLISECRHGLDRLSWKENKLFYLWWCFYYSCDAVRWP